MKKFKYVYVITSNSKYSDSTEKSFICRICKSYNFAKKLMESIYNDAAKNRVCRIGQYSNPKWLDDEHRSIEVTNTINVGWMSIKTIETFHLTTELEENIFSNKSWILG